MIVEYNGQMVSLYRLSKLSGRPLSSLYRAYHSGLRAGDEIVNEASKHLVRYKGELITIKRLCTLTKSNYGSVKRRLDAGMPPEKAVNDSSDRRQPQPPIKISPTDVIKIYTSAFKKEKTQSLIAAEFNIHQSTVSDIWRHKRWEWLTAPLRYELERINNKN